jgi:orotidine-5'-phosphate decarboxylase
MFFQQMAQRQKKQQTFLCVGLDPLPEQMPQGEDGRPVPTLSFLKKIVDMTHDLVCAYKPQIAHFAAQALESELKEIMDYIKIHHPQIPVILDAKRGDIGSTAQMYAQEAFERYQADAVTLNPYMGGDTLSPFTDRRDKGVFVLCRTSNPGASELQNIKPAGSDRALYYHVAMKAMGDWNSHDNIGLVVGATAIEELRELRADFPEAWFLIPGIGAQGGDLQAVLEYGCQTAGTGGGIVNSSRSILYASSGPDFAEAAREEAHKLQAIMKNYF